MKNLLIGVLLTASVGSAALAQIDTTRARPPVPPAQPPLQAQDNQPLPAEVSNAVKRAVVCSAITEHEPIDSLTSVSPTTGRVFFFTELVGLDGKTIVHRWMRDNTKVAEVRIAVASNRYRCHSSRSVSGKNGQWTVQVVSEDGATLAERTFKVGAPNGQTPLGY